MLEGLMIYAAPAAVGRVAIKPPMNGPLRSTAIDARTTIAAVITIFRTSPDQNRSSGDIKPSGTICPPIFSVACHQ